MAGVTPDEGQSYIAEAVYRKEALDLVMGLFTNSAGLGITSTWADIIQPSGGAYAEKALTAGTFTVAASGVTTYPIQTWTASGGAITPAVYGYYVRTSEGTPRLLHFEFNSGPRTVADGADYAVNLNTDTEN